MRPFSETQLVQQLRHGDGMRFGTAAKMRVPTRESPQAGEADGVQVRARNGAAPLTRPAAET